MNRFIAWGAAAAGLIVILATIPRSTQGLKPVERFEDKYNVLADNQTGDIYAWVDFNGVQRFVKLDKPSEGAVRKNAAPASDKNAEVQEADVRSGNIFEKQGNIKVGANTYNVDTKIKYREKEQSMLYRVSISVNPKVDPKTNKPASCITQAQAKSLRSVFENDGSSMDVRFEDSDKFWVKDVTIPLFVKAANNKVSSIIDGIEDSCGQVKEIVFHGVAQNLTFPEYTWVDNGKLILKGVKITPATAQAAAKQ
jgi:hypothetical protein